ncbi:MAG: phosphate ABC transporter permease PstA [Alphaproteobacteria bacterium]|nr:phosphate ABC transporter permease PstA [Alphaproteobacteria bacterium]
MNDVATDRTAAAAPAARQSRHMTPEAIRRLKRRYAAERRFKAYGIAAMTFAAAALLLLLVTVVGNGYTAFWQTQLRIEVFFDPDAIAPAGTTDRRRLMGADYRTVLLDAVSARFPEVRDRDGLRQLEGLVGSGAEVQLRDMVVADPGLIGQRRQVWLLAHSDIDMLIKGQTRLGDGARVTERQAGWLTALARGGDVDQFFNTRFFTGADSRDPELVGILGGVVGTTFTLLICLLLAFPLGVMAAVYLEEYAPKNRLTDIIEVNINNLAAVPSIVFGLLGLSVFINFFGMPRSAPLVGGSVLALMSLPTIIIAARAALRAVPPSIREGALGVGASKMQMIGHHVLPLAMPGILTGTIIAMAHALGETAPLLMIGMVAFITDIPTDPLSASTVLPVQIFMWADHPERGFVEKTSAGIIVLLVFMLVMNASAVWLRRKFERRW